MSIVALDLKTAKFLTTAQIITSVSTAVKELVENALDAGASNIEIKLEDNGVSLFEVSDNGNGIAKADTVFMAQQSYTSKIKDFADLDALKSYGFRGEALASLCRVADVTIITKTVDDEAARLYRMNHNGNIESSELFHRSVGTTVQARSIFKDLPVRRQMLNNSKRANQDVKSLENLLRSFAICHPRVRISYRVNGSNILTKPSTETTKESLTYLFGKKFIAQVDFIDKKTQAVDVHLVIPAKDATELLEVCQGGQRVFVNQRPISYKEIEKIVNQRLVEHFGDKIPARKKLGFLAILNVPPADVDVNLEPNKTAVLLTNLANIVETLDNLLVEYYGIVEKSEEKSLAEKPTTSSNDSTCEYHDYTTTEIKASSESVAPSSSKKRKLEDKTEKGIARGGSAVKIASAVGPEKTPKLRRTAMKLFDYVENKENQFSNNKDEPTSETISQLPVVDLGADFSTQEISKVLNRDAGESESILQNSAIDDSRSSVVVPEVANEVTEEEWSKGQVSINLQGGTDVRIYSNAKADVETEVEEPEADTNSTGCKGFSKFSRETRPEILRDNPGINYVEAAQLLARRWKELSSEERGYYRDLAAADAAQQSHETSTSSTKSSKKKISTEHAESNRKRFLSMLENMKSTKSGGKKESSKMKTVIPWTVDVEAVTSSFTKRQSGASTKNSVVLGALNENVWLARTGCQLWALSITELFGSLGLEKSDETKNTRENVEELVKKLLQNEESLSLLHPIYEFT